MRYFLRLIAALATAGATFAGVLLAYEVGAHYLLGPTAFDTDAVLNVSRFAAAFMTGIATGVAVMIPGSRRRDALQ